MQISWNDSLWFMQLDNGMIIGNDINIKYRLTGNDQYYNLCCDIRDRLKNNKLTLSELSDYLSKDLPNAIIKDVITNLFNLGMIIETPTETNTVTHELTNYFETYPCNKAVATTNFLSSNIGIIANERLIKIFKNLCRESDISNVRYLINKYDKINEEEIKQLIVKNDILLAATDNVIEQVTLFPLLNRIAIEGKKSILLGSVENKKAHLGPLIIPGETACYNCMEIRKENNLPNLAEYQIFKTRISDVRDHQIKAPSSVAQHYLCNLLLFDAIKFIARVQMPATYQHVNIYDTDTHESESHYIVKVPLCNVCGAHSVRPFSKIWSI